MARAKKTAMEPSRSATKKSRTAESAAAAKTASSRPTAAVKTRSKSEPKRGSAQSDAQPKSESAEPDREFYRELFQDEDDARAKLADFTQKTHDWQARRAAKLDRLEQKLARQLDIRAAREQRRAGSSLAMKHPRIYAVSAMLQRPFIAIGRWRRDWLEPRLGRRAQERARKSPHRSFYLTERGTDRRRWKIQSYTAFARGVWRLIWKNKGLFFKFFLLYAIISAVILGLMDQSTYASLRDALDQVKADGITKISTLVSSALSGGLTVSGDATQSQQVFSVLLVLYGWLTLVWLLRALLRGEKPKLRDGLYSGGSGVFATFMIFVVIILQLLPFALVLLAYTSVTAVGWINSGIAIENMAAWAALAVAAVLTLYWLVSSLIALAIVPLEGAYPMEALRLAGDLVMGRRLRILLRVLFMFVPLILLWAVLLIPAILLDGLLKLSWLPLVPVVVLILTTLSLIWIVSYIYLLYRDLLDDPTPPVDKNYVRSPVHKWQIWRRWGRKKSTKNVPEKAKTRSQNSRKIRR
jgi:hypothetical protein